ncbi:hypothetical protein H8959_007583 [Pygathrix nigripes]
MRGWRRNLALCLQRLPDEALRLNRCAGPPGLLPAYLLSDREGTGGGRRTRAGVLPLLRKSLDLVLMKNSQNWESGAGAWVHAHFLNKAASGANELPAVKHLLIALNQALGKDEATVLLQVKPELRGFASSLASPLSFLAEDTTDFPDELDISFFAQEGILHEELSTYLDEVFESPSEAALQDWEKAPEQEDLTSSTLDRTSQPKVRLRQEVVSTAGPRRGQRIAVPVCKFFAREKQLYGLSMVGQLTSRTYHKHIDSSIRRQIEDMDNHRPFFTYWFTFMHSLVTVLAGCIYGIMPVGFSQHEMVDSVLWNHGVYENIKYMQQDNFWIGPSSEALIHLGAKFSPCVCQDPQVHSFICSGCRPECEKQLACCVHNDRSGCLQTSEEECSSTLAVWVTWPIHPSAPELASHKRQFGSVCHQDPRVCDKPSWEDPHEWPEDITKWPICTKNSARNHTNLLHMDGVITGWSCCVGTKGKYEITSREYCDFMMGYFHEEATLCSQVHCMDDVCGLLPFLNPEVPDQFYRLWLSLFLHTRILHCLPYISFGKFNLYQKCCQIIIFQVVFLGLLAGLVVLFYFYPVHCEWCEFLTCIPLLTSSSRSTNWMLSSTKLAVGSRDHALQQARARHDNPEPHRLTGVTCSMWGLACFLKTDLLCLVHFC